MNRSRKMRLGFALSALMLCKACGVPLEGYAVPPDPNGWNGEGGFIQFEFPEGSRELSEGFRRASEGEAYFGALHIDRQSERYAYTRNYNSLEAAITVSKLACQADAGRSCVLAMLVLPDALPAETRRASGFSVWTYYLYSWSYPRAQEAGRWGAFAVSGLASSGYSGRFPTEAGAKERALSTCNAAVEKELLEMGSAASIAVRKAGYTRCRIIHVTNPDV
jgi:hypothetical protein